MGLRRNPLYTFAEGTSLDVGFMLLMSGTHITANPFSVLGDIGKDYKIVVIDRLMERLKIRHLKFPKGIPFSYSETVQNILSALLKSLQRVIENS